MLKGNNIPVSVKYKEPKQHRALQTSFFSIDPFHVCGNAAKLEDKTKEIFASVKQSYCSVLQIGCIPTDVKGVYITFSHLRTESVSYVFLST